MKINLARNQSLRRPSVLIVSLLMVSAALVALSSLNQAPAIRIRIDQKGTARVGMLPLESKVVRKAVFATIHWAFPKASIEVVGADRAPQEEVISVLQSLMSAGVPLCSVATRSKPGVRNDSAHQGPAR